eukprot:scaffold242035_cov30-Tisochrysis_lutea.AAC.4
MRSLLPVRLACAGNSSHSFVLLLYTTTPHEAVSVRAGQKDTMAMLSLRSSSASREWSVTTPKRMLGAADAPSILAIVKCESPSRRAAGGLGGAG